LGSLTREFSWLAAPAAFAYLWERNLLRAEWKKVTLALVPGIAGFLLVRWLIHVPGSSGLLAALLFYPQVFLACVGTLGRLESWYRIFINAFTPFSLVPLIYWKTTKVFFARHRYMLLFVGLVFIGTVYGGNSNHERLEAPAFLVFYLLLATIIQDFLWPRKWILTILVTAAFLASLHHLYGIHPSLPDRNYTLALSVGSLLLVTVATFLFKVLGPGNSSAGELPPSPADSLPRGLV
jgi:hypothetical protein